MECSIQRGELKYGELKKCSNIPRVDAAILHGKSFGTVLFFSLM